MVSPRVRQYNGAFLDADSVRSATVQMDPSRIGQGAGDATEEPEVLMLLTNANEGEMVNGFKEFQQWLYHKD